MTSSGRFLECWKCNMLVATQALVHCLICPHLPLGIVCRYQAMHSCLCYNYYLLSYTCVAMYIPAVQGLAYNHYTSQNAISRSPKP